MYLGAIVFVVLFYMYFNKLFDVFFYDAYREEVTDLEIPSYLVIGIFLSTLVLLNINKGLKLIPLSYIAISIFFLLNLGGRGPILNLVICFLAFTFLSKNFKKVFNFKTVSILAVLGIGLFFVFSEGSINTYNQYINIDRYNPFIIAEFDPSVLARYKFLQLGWESFLDHPFFGLGIGSSGIILSGIDKSLYPHNIFLETAMEIGFVGSLLMIFFYFKFFITERKAVIFPAKNILYIIVLLYFLEDLKSGSLDSWRISLFWFAI